MTRRALFARAAALVAALCPLTTRAVSRATPAEYIEINGHRYTLFLVRAQTWPVVAPPVYSDILLTGRAER